MMLPPDRNMFKSEQKAPLPESSPLEKLVRRLEKDDILLYVTAIFGVFMPALIYVIYHKVHAMYYCSSEERRKEKKANKSKKREKAKNNLTIFYSGTISKMKQIAYTFAEKLEFLDPLVVNLHETNLVAFGSYKGTALFLMDIKDNNSSKYQFFIDWLNEFSLFVVIEDESDYTVAEKFFSVLNKGLCKIGALPLCEMKIVKAQDNEELEKVATSWIDEFCNYLKSNEHYIDAQNSENLSSDSETSQFSKLDDFDESESEADYAEACAKNKRI